MLTDIKAICNYFHLLETDFRYSRMPFKGGRTALISILNVTITPFIIRSNEQHDDVGDDSSPFLHLTSAGLGLAAIVVFFPDSWRVLTAIVLVSASLFQFLPKLSTSASQHLALYLSAFLWTAATYLELKMDGPTWHKLRGPALLVAMKVLSVAIDEEKPSWEQLLGYLLCPG